MASNTYTVKSGDTLSGIAKALGVNMGQLSGYKSGDPNLIMPGEQLNVGGQSGAGNFMVDQSPSGGTSATKDITAAGGTQKAPGASTGASKNPEADSYLSTVKSLLGSLGNNSAYTAPTDEYLKGLRTTSDAAAKALADVQTKTYNDEYAKSGLDVTKSKIAGLDTEIANAKAARDDAVLGVRKNPALSASQMTGIAGKLADRANQRINALIEQRNGLAGDYNTGLKMLDTKVGNIVGDKKNAYTIASTQAKNYQDALLSGLKNNTDTGYKNATLAVSLYNAMNKAGNPNLKLQVSPVTGDPLYWYDADGNVFPITPGQKTAAGGAPAADVTPAADNSGDTTGSDTTDSTPWYKKLLNFFTG